jgi:competence protein ComEA
MLRIAIVAAVLILAAFLVFHPPAAPPPPLEAAPATQRPLPKGDPLRSPFPCLSSRRGTPFRSSPCGSDVVVYVVGAVLRPGLYRLGDGARVDDAVRAAGGVLAGADPVAVNLAARVQDGDEIVVPVLGETPRASKAKRPRGVRTRSAKHYAVTDVNTADAAALAMLPGIGKTIAARIVAVRERDGPFANLDELLDVAGMTEGKLARAEPYLTL